MTSLFFRNPRLLVLAISLIVVAGLSSFYVLPQAEDPELVSRFAIVTAVLPGADASRVESLVAERIENEIREIDEVKDVSSSSRSGTAVFGVELEEDVLAVDEVWARIRDRLRQLLPKLPKGTLPLDLEKIKVKANSMIIALKWQRKDEVNYRLLRRLAKQLRDQVELVEGTESAELYGAPEEEFVVSIDPERIAAVGLSASKIAAKLEASDAKVASGQLRGSKHDLVLKVDTELNSLEKIGETPLSSSSTGQMVQLADVATTKRSIVRPLQSAAFCSGFDSVVIGARVRSDYQISSWTQKVDRKIKQFQSSLPDGIQLEAIFRQNRYVSGRLKSLFLNLALGCIAVIGVTWFLMGLRNALVVAISLPLSALMVLAGMRAVGLPVHQMSITGLIIALGLLIDNAIIVVDETSHRLSQGQTAGEAVSGSVGMLAIPLLGSTVTTAFSFAPIILMDGANGEFVGGIGVSVILAIFSSLFLALTVMPALTVFSKNREEASRGNGFSSDVLTAMYEKLLWLCFRVPLVGFLVAFPLPLLGFLAATLLPLQFFPPADRDQVNVEFESAAGTSMEETKRLAKAMRERLNEYPEVKEVHWFLGESSPSFYYNVIRRNRRQSSYAQGIVNLKSSWATARLIRKMQYDLDRSFPETRVLVKQLEQGPPFEAPVEVRIFGPDLETLTTLGREVRKVLASTPGISHTRSELDETVAKLSMDVDQSKARLVGLTPGEIAGQMQASLEGATGGSVVESSNKLPVRVRVPGARRGSFDQIASTDLVAGETGGPRFSVPLSSLAKLNIASSNAGIPRLNGKRMNEIQGFIPAGVLPATVLDRFKQRLRKSGFKLPVGYTLDFGGEEETRSTAVSSLLASVSVIVVLMVTTLVLTFGSFRQAAIIFLVAGLSVGLSFFSLFLFQFPLSFMAMVGTMGLIGIAINDSIVVLAAIGQDAAAASGSVMDVVKVVVRSTRHVIATTLTTVAGFTPLFLSGGGFWPPLAVAIAGGVVGATLLALVFVPTAYLFVCTESQRANPSPS